jgi:valyl-tRNA synthetase
LKNSCSYFIRICRLYQRNEGDDITIRQLPAAGSVDATVINNGFLLKEVITSLRDTRIKHQLKPKDSVVLHIETNTPEAYQSFKTILTKQVNATEVLFSSSAVAGTISTVVQKDKFYLETGTLIDSASQKEALLKDLDYQKGFLASVEKKLTNERFVQNAKPEVVELERKKKADAEAKIKAIEESLATL